MSLKMKYVSVLHKYIKCLSWGIILFASQVYAKGKVKPRTGHEGSEGKVVVKLYSFVNLGTRLGLVVNSVPWLLCRRERHPVPFVLEAGWVPGQIWMGVQNLAPNRDLIPGPLTP